jgi:hypothetical protein
MDNASGIEGPDVGQHSLLAIIKAMIVRTRHKVDAKPLEVVKKPWVASHPGPRGMCGGVFVVMKQHLPVCKADISAPQ